MPSNSSQLDRGAPRNRIDMVLGDCHGAACHPVIIETAHRMLREKGYVVARNTPYAGGFTTVHYGKPKEGGHCLQIEISRSLYMNERSFERKPFLARLVEDMRDLAATLTAVDPSLLQPS
jgi:N-formylglutamate amidohydrolase